VINGTDFLVVVFLCPTGHFFVTLSSLSVLLNYKIRMNFCVYSLDAFLMRKQFCLPKTYLTTHQANKHTPPYCMLIICSCLRRPLCCPPSPMPITRRRRPLTYGSLPTPPTIRPLGAASLDFGCGREGAIGQRAAPPGDRGWRGRATKSVVGAATDYNMFLYHLFVCLFFDPLIDASTMHPVPTCDGFTFFPRESVPLMGRISRDAEKALPNKILF
jgi:hypothetical protein